VADAEQREDRDGEKGDEETNAVKSHAEAECLDVLVDTRQTLLC
jgi:hypothetical protein